MKQRKFKFSLGMKIASILSCIALVSVGFASWWIVRLPSPVTKGGSFEVYTVEEKKINYTDVNFVTEAGVKDESPKIAFGYVTDSSITTPWLGYSTTGTDKMAEEKLSAILQFNVAVDNDDTDDKINTYMTKVNVALTIPETYKTLLSTGTTGYVAAPVIKYRVGTTGTNSAITWKDASTDSGWKSTTATVDTTGLIYSVNFDAPAEHAAVIQVKFEFDWAYYHNNKVQNENPYVYFNKIEGGYTPELATDAKDVLDKIHTLNSGTFSVKISSTPEGPAATTAS